MVKRSVANKQQFLKSSGLKSIPKGYEIDHILPLSQGGTDCPDNMQLITVDEHRKKTVRERNKVNN
ncbi:MAG: HNH endonuclease signature motif containing protein [Bacteroidia bacterium]